MKRIIFRRKKHAFKLGVWLRYNLLISICIFQTIIDKKCGALCKQVGMIIILSYTYAYPTQSPFFYKIFLKGDYARTGASDFKHLPAVIPNFFSEYTMVMVNIVVSIKNLSFSMVLYQKNFKM